MRARQHGVALMLMAVIMVLGASFLVLRSLNAATTRADRHRVTQDALIRAKEGLIARAVIDLSATPAGTRPGSLPCPDLDDDGVAELFAGNQCPSYIGRLPWRTLDLPDLRDANGERLWYALSTNFRDNAAGGALNSNTAGLLSVAGTQPAAGLAAIVFAPGAVVARAGVLQSRGCTVGVNCDVNLYCTAGIATPKCNPANYLEISGGVDNANGDATYVAAAESETFNDRHIEITVDDIMWHVEKRAGRELGAKLRAHFDAWQNATTVANTKGFYPWAAPFNDPATASPGVDGTQTGQLPMSDANVVWSSATFTLGSCSGVGTNQITCSGVVLCIVACLTRIDASLSGIATTFVDPPNGSETSINGLLISLGAPNTGTWTLNPSAQTLDYAYNAGGLIVVGLVEVTVSAPMTSTWTTSATDWVINNNWPQVTHYSVSPDYALNGTNACAASCISVANSADKQAVLTMTGRALAGQTRVVPAALNTYLEGGNQDPADFVLERGMKTPAFNDQPIAVRP
jgi:hypothetical protein